MLPRPVLLCHDRFRFVVICYGMVCELIAEDAVYMLTDVDAVFSCVKPYDIYVKVSYVMPCCVMFLDHGNRR